MFAQILGAAAFSARAGLGRTFGLPPVVGPALLRLAGLAAAAVIALSGAASLAGVPGGLGASGRLGATLLGLALAVGLRPSRGGLRRGLALGLPGGVACPAPRLPEIHRPRFRRLVLASRPALARAWLPGVLAGAPCVLGGLSGGRALWADVRAGVALSVLGVVVAWALAMAGAAAEAVATQRSRFGTGPANGLYPPSDADLGVALDKLLPLLGGRGGALDQVLAFQEVCTLAERGGVRGRSWLKQCVLGGGGGAAAQRWGDLASALLAPLQALTAAFALCLGAESEPAGAAGSGPGARSGAAGLGGFLAGRDRHRASRGAGPGEKRPRDASKDARARAAALLASSQQPAAWGVRALVALADTAVDSASPIWAAGGGSSGFPRLPHLVLEVASGLHAVRQYIRSWAHLSVSDPSFRGLSEQLQGRLEGDAPEAEGLGAGDVPGVGALTWALEDALRVALYTLVEAVASGLGPADRAQLAVALLESSAKPGAFRELPGAFPEVFVEEPACGSRADVAQLLRCCLLNEL